MEKLVIRDASMAEARSGISRQVIITLKTIQISLPSLMEYNTGLYQ